MYTLKWQRHDACTSPAVFSALTKTHKKEGYDLTLVVVSMFLSVMVATSPLFQRSFLVVGVCFMIFPNITSHTINISHKWHGHVSKCESWKVVVHRLKQA